MEYGDNPDTDENPDREAMREQALCELAEMEAER